MSLPPPSPDPPPTPAVRRYGWQAARHLVWALPVYALGRMWLSLLEVPDPAGDPAAWADRVTDDGYQRGQVLAGINGQLLVLVGLVALAALVSGRGRRFAAVGLLAGLTAVVLALPRLSLAAFAAPVLGERAQDGAPVAAQWYEHMYARTGPAAFLGAGLLGLAFLLLGIAAWRCSSLGRADGLLLVAAGPLLVAGAWYQPMLTPLGALPLLAAGVSIAWSGGGPARNP
jgi:Amt family ammonium transporter